MKKAELIATLNQFLIEQYAAGRKVLLIVDEAQNLSNRVLEEIRLLSGVETTKEKVLRIILAGQPELNDKLDSPGAGAARAARAAALPPDGAARRRTRTPISCTAWRSPARTAAQIFADDTFPVIYRYYRRRAAPDQHAVRHRDDERLLRGTRTSSASASCRRRSRNCSGSNTPRALPRCASSASPRHARGCIAS